MSGSDVQWDLDGRHDDLEVAVSGAGVSPVFQPIVSLPTGTTIGFEALARWPLQPHLGPQSVFAHAEKTDRLTELDRLCIDRAVDGALRGGLTEGALLGVNSEPASEYTGRADSEILQRGHEKFALVFEITERNLLGHLPTLLRKLTALRADGIAIALDDVGTNPESLAILDIVCPEIIKLATELIQSPPCVETARIGAAIMAHRERRGSLVIAEGIETDRHFDQALAWGATMGQGFLFGRPAPLPFASGTVPWLAPVVRTGVPETFDSPFDVVADDPHVRVARRETLLALSWHLEEQARTAWDTPIVLSAFRHGDHFGPSRVRYAALAETCPLVAVFGVDIAAHRPAMVRAVDLDASDALCRQWVVVTMGPSTAAALIARECVGDGEEDEDRRFEFVVTHDRTVIRAAAVALLKRVPR